MPVRPWRLLARPQTITAAATAAVRSADDVLSAHNIRPLAPNDGSYSRRKSASRKVEKRRNDD